MAELHSTARDLRRSFGVAACVIVVLLLIPTGASASFSSLLAGPPDLPLERGDRGDGVEELQLLLSATGHPPGPVDGRFGPMTESAVKTFQAAQSLGVTGTVDQSTWDALVGAAPDALLQRGDRGDDVRTLQRLLTLAGFDAGVIDGIFGPMTKGAVEAFQSARGLQVTGLVDQGTWDALESDAPQILLQRGDRGQEVRSLQLLLASAGFNPGPIDGIFGGLTQSAVTSFQTANDLAVTGQVDQTTMDALVLVAEAPTILYQRGASGPKVEGIQEQLATVGFNPGPIDGVFGPMTERAVTRFHNVHGLAGEGGVTQATIDKLEQLLPLALTAYDYGYDPNAGPEQWRGLITEVFGAIGLDEEACGEGSRSADCLGPQIDNAIKIMTCESRGVPMVVNHRSGTTGLFQHRPVFWAERVARARDLFPTLPATATPYNPEHNIMVAALLVYESREALLGNNSFNKPWSDGPQPWGHWDGCGRSVSPRLVNP